MNHCLAMQALHRSLVFGIPAMSAIRVWFLHLNRQSAIPSNPNKQTFWRIKTSRLLFSLKLCVPPTISTSLSPQTACGMRVCDLWLWTLAWRGGETSQRRGERPVHRRFRQADRPVVRDPSAARVCIPLVYLILDVSFFYNSSSWAPRRTTTWDGGGVSWLGGLRLQLAASTQGGLEVGWRDRFHGSVFMANSSQ
jgi:hypothetical protein